jgi:DnaJ-class molecular chaperone
VTEKEVSFAQAALGDQVDIETIHGNVKLRIPPSTQPSTLFRLKEKGVPRLSGSGKGDHYVRIKVTIPKNLTKKQKELLQEFDKESSSKKSWF